MMKENVKPKQSLVYTYEILNSEDIIEILSSDIENENIERIIIPHFLFKIANKKLTAKKTIEKIEIIEKSPKIKIDNFSMMYDEEKYGFSYFTLFMEYIKQKRTYKNIYVRIPLYSQEAIECLKLGYKVFVENQEDEIGSILKNISPHNYVKARSNIAFIDTCYFVKMFESYIGLNLLCENNTKKIIPSCVLEEMLHIDKQEIFKYLICILNERKKYNIKLISTPAAYDELYVCNDLSMLSQIYHYKNKLTVYSYDITLIHKCIALNIKTSSKPDTIKIDTEANTDIQNKDTENKEGQTNIIVPIVFKKNQFYISEEYIEYALLDITNGLYAEIQYFVKNKRKMINIREGGYVKVKNESFLYKVVEIDKIKNKATLERSSLSLKGLSLKTLYRKTN